MDAQNAPNSDPVSLLQKEFAAACRVIQGTNIGALLLDQNGVILSLNSMMISVLFFEKSEVFGRLLWSELPPLSRALFEASFNRAVAQKTPTQRDLNFGDRWFDCRLTPQTGPSGEIIGVIVLGWDITESKQLGEPLRQLAMCGDGVFWISDLQLTHIKFVSPAYQQVWGRTCESLYQRPETFLESIHPDDRERVHSALRPHLEHRHAPFEIEYRILRPDGSVRWIRDRGYPIKSSAGEGEEYVGIAEDVTPRKMSEVELQQKQQRHEAVLQSAIDGYCCLDVEGRIQEVNESFCRSHGYLREELLQMPIFELEAIETRVETANHIHQIKLAGYERFETRHRRKDGTEFEVEISVCCPDRDLGVQFAFVRDLSERMDAEKSLRERDYFLAESQRIGRIGSYSLDIPSSVWIASDVLDEIFGLEPNAVKTVERWNSMIYPEDQGMMLRYFLHEVVELRQPFDKEYRIVRQKDGAVRWVWGRGELSFNNAGQPVRMTGTIQDITDRKNSEESLRRLNRELQAIVSCNQAIFHARDEGSLLQDVCRIVCDCGQYRMAWVGFALKDESKTVKPVAWGGAVGNYLDKINVSWADVPHGRGPAGTCIRTGKIYYSNNVETDPSMVPWRQSALQHGYCSLIALPLKNETGDTFGCMSIYDAKPEAFTPQEIRLLTNLVDDLAFGIINLRLRETRRLADIEMRKLSQAVEQSPASIVIADLSGAIEYVNPKFTQTTGYRFEEVRTKNFRELPGHLKEEGDYQRMWHTVTSGKEWQGEIHRQKQTGESYWEISTISPIFAPDGQITHFLAVNEDMTERKHLEEQLRQVQKLEAVGQLAGGVAHDFNNMLASIMLNLGLLQQRQDLDAEMRDALAELMRDTGRSAKLTRQLLMFSRRSVLEVKTLDLNEVVAGFLKMLQRLIGEHVEFEFVPNVTLPPVEADPSMMEQVLMNLCVNARDAMPKGGRITIELASTEASAAKVAAYPGVMAGQFVCLSVADTGCGMDELTLRRIFEPFFTTKEPNQGTGLGLATVHGIVGQHKGWVEVESALGRGSVFRIYLPVAKNRLPQLETEPQAATQVGSEALLLVEDEALLRRVTAKSLRRLGYQVYEAANGAEAMAVWNQCKDSVDLLLTDMVMPGGMTGLELANKLREDRPELKVVLCSGYSAESFNTSAMTATRALRLQKPYQIEDLARMIRLGLAASR